jgi:hypothetical protein
MYGTSVLPFLWSHWYLSMLNHQPAMVGHRYWCLFHSTHCIRRPSHSLEGL